MYRFVRETEIHFKFSLITYKSKLGKQKEYDWFRA